MKNKYFDISYTNVLEKKKNDILYMHYIKKKFEIIFFS